MSMLLRIDPLFVSLNRVDWTPILSRAHSIFASSNNKLYNIP